MSQSMLIQTRSEAAKSQRDRRLSEWFGNRRWRVCTEVTAERKDGRDTVTYDHGEFWIVSSGTPKTTFQTPFGHNGTHGFLIQEIDPRTHADLPASEPVCFGHSLLAKVQDLYKCFPAGLPAERKRPPRSA